MAKDGSKFDVYAMMLILSFFMVVGACLLMNDELASNWNFKLGGDPPPKDQKWHITEYRELKTYPVPYVDLREKDLAEWKVAHNASGAVNGESFPVQGYEWPKDANGVRYKVDQFPVDPLKDNNWESALPSPTDDEVTKTRKKEMMDQFLLLLSTAPKEGAAEPAKEPAKEPEKDPAKEPAAPPTDAPKADAPKADAPKADAPKADGEKKEAAPDAPKADAQKVPPPENK